MSRAFVIEVYNRTAGIVARHEHGFSFFSSELQYDVLDGRSLPSVREAELAAAALLKAHTLRARSLII